MHHSCYRGGEIPRSAWYISSTSSKPSKGDKKGNGTSSSCLVSGSDSFCHEFPDLKSLSFLVEYEAGCLAGK